METFSSVNEILDFAIAQELAANQFYLHMAGRMNNPAMRKVFEDFANEELGHKAKLENMKTIKYSPALDNNGLLYTISKDGKLHIISTTSMGLDESPWPKYRGNSQNSGRIFQ